MASTPPPPAAWPTPRPRARRPPCCCRPTCPSPAWRTSRRCCDLWNLAPLLAVCPDEAEDGTNALLLAPPGDFTFRYGPGSFRAHLAEAERRGRPAHVVPAPGLRFDLDTESDWLVYNGYLVGVGEE